MTTVGKALAASVLPPLEARALLASLCGVARETLIAFPERALDESVRQAFEAACARRTAGEPLAYLVGEKEFFGLSFRVNRDVLIPRPETELLVEVALALIQGRRPPRVLDLGTGSGCIAVTLALRIPGATVTAVDRSAAALVVAHGNADRHGASLRFVRSDWFSAVSGQFDLIVGNPPYVAAGDPHLDALRFEPTVALTDDADGLSCLRRIANAAPTFLAPEGWLIVEHGHDQGQAVRDLFTAAGLRDVQTQRDLAGIARVCRGRRAQ